MSFITKLWRRLTGRVERRYTVKLRGKGFPGAKQYVPSDTMLAHVRKASVTVDLRAQDGPIFDQGSLGSCTAQGWSGLFMFLCIKLFGEQFVGSRIMLYWCERELSGNVNDDTGAEVADGAKVLSTTGVCDEKLWPHNISKYKVKPPAECYADAAKHKLVEPLQMVQDLDHMKSCLSEGFPFVFGFEVYSSFESWSTSRTGIVPMPKKNESLLGGHEVEAIGYVDASGAAHFARTSDAVMYGLGRVALKLNHGLRILTGARAFKVTPPANTFIIRNSWGSGWGDSGYGYMPFEYLASKKLCSDFWTARHATNGDKAA